MIGLISWFLLISSATLYALPFFCISKLWWSIFIFPLPLLLMCMHQRMRFMHGFVWGLVLFSLHLIGVFPYLTTIAGDSVLLRLAPVACILIYLPLISGVFFWATQHIITLFSWQSSPSYALAIWILALYKYLYALANFSLIVFGRSEGYALLDPLIPLTAYPPLLSLLPLLGQLTFLLAFVSTAASLVWIIVTRTLRSCIPLASLIVFWLINIAQHPAPEPTPPWLATLVMLPTTFPETESPFKARNEALVEVQQLVQKFPCVEVVITPESAFYAEQFHDPALHSIFDQDHIGKKIYLVMGAFARNDNNYYNCLHVVHDGTIEHTFYKRHAMLLTERLPLLFDSAYTRSHYFAQTPPISIGTKERPLIQLTDQISFVPYICSELFFNEEPDDLYPYTPILALCNDRWCWHYFADVMYHAAQLKALVWQRPVIYSTFYHHAYCGPTGHIIPLPAYRSE